MHDYDYYRIEKAIRFLEGNYEAQPTLEEIADSAGLSKYHFQRLFRRWAGVSPKRFLQFLTVEHAKRLLRESASVLDATWDSGLSSPGRLHDLFLSTEAVTPGDFKRGGEGLILRWARHATPFGDAVITCTDRGIVALRFLIGDEVDGVVAEVTGQWPEATLIEDAEATAPVIRQVFDVEARPADGLLLQLRGTNFQIRVWEALLRIPEGAVATYGELASAVCSPKAVRAVGSAIGRNPIAYLIPCHRVLRATGAFGGYRWGDARKKAILGWEQARSSVRAEAIPA